MRIGGRCRALAAALLAAICLSAAAAADDFPSRPLTLIVPFPPGGSTNFVMRIVADKLSELLGQQVVVDNRAGAGGTAGTRAVAKSTPDGYTIGLGFSGPLAIAPTLYSNLGYDPRKDFAPIGRVATAPNSLVAHPSFPAKSIAELIAYVKAHPGVNFGSAGIGTVSHLAGELFAARAGIRFVHIPYKGTGPTLTDLIGGHIPLAFAPFPASHAQATGGSVRMLAVTGLARSSLLPEVPTIAESGLPGYEAVVRYGLVAPAGTPRAIIERLNTALNVALASADVRQRLAAEGADPLPSTPDEYAADIDREETQWSKVVKESGAKVE
jgi:tripartite-type tricarboxylate transporter receptor subunit TctC